MTDEDITDVQFDVLNDLSDLPTAIIVANLPNCVFTESGPREELEHLFRSICSDPEVAQNIRFDYLKSFKRARVTYPESKSATAARIHAHNFYFYDCYLRCFYAQHEDIMSIPPQTSSGNELQPPKLEKLFLISPPASPPVGWKQSEEAAPVVDFELLAKLSALAHREPTHGGTSYDRQEDEPMSATTSPMDPEGESIVSKEIFKKHGSLPSIVLHVCNDIPDAPFARPKIQQTRRPDAC